MAENMASKVPIMDRDHYTASVYHHIPTLHKHSRVHLERLAVFLAFRADFASTSRATRASFMGKKPHNIQKRHDFFTSMANKQELSLQLHQIKTPDIMRAAEFLFHTGHLAPKSALNKVFALVPAQQILDTKWRASASLPALGNKIDATGFWESRFEPVFNPDSEPALDYGSDVERTAAAISTALVKKELDTSIKTRKGGAAKQMIQPNPQYTWNNYMEGFNEYVEQRQHRRCRLGAYEKTYDSPACFGSNVQNTLMNALQELLERSLFNFATRIWPDEMKASKADSWQAVPLEKWRDALCGFKHTTEAHLHSGYTVKRVKELYQRVTVIRYIAIHRRPCIQLEAIYNMCKDATELVKALGDPREMLLDILTQKVRIVFEEHIHSDVDIQDLKTRVRASLRIYDSSDQTYGLPTSRLTEIMQLMRSLTTQSLRVGSTSTMMKTGVEDEVVENAPSIREVSNDANTDLVSPSPDPGNEAPDKVSSAKSPANDAEVPANDVEVHANVAQAGAALLESDSEIELLMSKPYVKVSPDIVDLTKDDDDDDDDE
ncbi:hypothetical protein EAF04_001027 [Stromatinia cepivora]|nr:hypothetical protein EAF04_001027 [Stromatinia cepivora]